MTSDALIVIPARHGSTRLPGKPLLTETGKPLVQHTYERAAQTGARVVVATDDARIEAAVKGFGGEVVMTRSDHETGSARVAEAVGGATARVIVNVQGDEPEIEPDSIRTLIDLHAACARSDLPAFLSTLVSAFPEDADPDSPDTVKAILSQPHADGTRSALWFSRSRLPYPRTQTAAPRLHIGMYAYSPASLAALAGLAPTPAERAESLEQLRVLEHGHRIAAAEVPPAAPGIDTPEDYAAFVARTQARA